MHSYECASNIEPSKSVQCLTKYRLGLHDPFRCGALLTQGNWLDPPGSSQSIPPYSNWSPSTCVMHKYRAEAIRQCIGQHKIVFIGDSQIRQIFWAVAMKVDRQQAEKEMAIANKHSDLFFSGPKNVSLDFIWDPYLNSTSLLKELTIASMEDPTSPRKSGPSILMVGGGLWFAKNLDEFSLQRYSESLENIFRILGLYDRNHTQPDILLETLPQRDQAFSLVMFAPIQRPLYASLDSAHAKTLTHARIQPLYEKLLQSWHKHKLSVLWAYDAMTKDQSEAYELDGLHVVDTVSTAMADLMLNIKCNSFLTSTEGYPMDKTCCSRYPQPNKAQLSFVYAAWSFPLIACLLPWILEPVVNFLQGKACQGRPVSRESDFRSIYTIGPLNFLLACKIWKSITVLSLTSYYCWLADRTHLYNKAQKQFASEDFMVLCSLTVVVGILSLYRSRSPVQQKNSRKEVPPQDFFLSRDQTDEWKGWMQMIILIYHYTGASKVLWIYKMVRLLVAGYLFLTGYGHTMFFYIKADYSLKRVASVLIRLNMLTCVLPYVMQTDYMFYYFAPLVSFWYLNVYATMAIGRSWNRVLIFFIFKIVTSAAVVTVLITSSPGIFKSVFLLLAKVCNIHWDIKDWEFRLRLDGYIVYFGMLVAAYTATNKGENVVYYTHTDGQVISVAQRARRAPSGFLLLETLRTYLQDKRCMYLTTACSGCLFYALFAYPASDKEAHNKVFSAASVGPILAFVALRNFFPWQGYHSSVFAWVGRCSLETFILQYHIWLAADSKGTLSTGLFDRKKELGKWLDFALLTILFLWVCRHVADATQTLTSYIVDPKSVEENNHLRENLPIARSSDGQEEKCSNGEASIVRNSAKGLIAERLVRGVTMAKSLIAELLWMRLLIILLMLWALNMAN